MTTSEIEEGGDWIDLHQRVWRQKPALRRFYKTEYFDRIVPAMPAGRSLEIGAGPGFFAGHHRCDVVSDVSDAPHIDRVVDAHDMPFEASSFASVVGVDVLHHCQHPAKAVGEIARVLEPGGRLILIEPWTGPAGYFVNKYLHDEECFPIADPWEPVFAGEKDALEGNATIPKTLFDRERIELERRSGLQVRTVEPFALFGYLATGGFTKFQLPDPLSAGFASLDRMLPKAALRQLALKVFIVAERNADPEAG